MPPSTSRRTSKANSKANSKASSARQSPAGKAGMVAQPVAEMPDAAAGIAAGESGRRVTRNATGAIKKTSLAEVAKRLDMPPPSGARPKAASAASKSKSNTPAKGPRPTAAAAAVNSEMDGVDEARASAGDPFVAMQQEAEAERANFKAALMGGGSKKDLAAASSSADVVDADAGGDAEAPKPTKAHRAEEVAAAAATAAAAAPRRNKKADKATEEALNRLKALSPLEKKACAALRDGIALLAAEAAWRTNRIPQLTFDLSAAISPVLGECEQAAAEADAAAAAKAAEEASKPAAAPAPIDADDAAVAPTPAAADDAAADAAAPAGTPGVAVVAPAPTAAGGPRVIPLPPADLPVVLKAVMAAVDAAKRDFDNNVEECQREPHEHLLLRPVAHAIAKALNEIEGYVAPTGIEYPDAAKAARAKLLAAAASKASKAEEKAKQKQAEIDARAAEKQRELLAKAEEKKQQELLARAAKGLGTEDMLLAHASDVVGITYAPLPLHAPALFEKALRIWAMVVSVPKLVKVSQMSFPLFLLGLQDSNPKASMMRDVVRGLIEASGGPDVNPGRGKEWLVNALAHLLTVLDEQVEDAVAAAKGTRLTAAQRKALVKQRREARAAAKVERNRRRRRGDDSDDDASIDFDDSDDDDEDEDDGSDDDDDDGDDDDAEEQEEEEEENEEKAAAEGDDGRSPAKSDAPPKPPKAPKPEGKLQRVRRETTEAQAALRELHAAYSPARVCSWANVSVEDRLTLLAFFVERMLESTKCANEAEAIHDRCHADLKKADARIKEIRDEAEKEAREISKIAKEVAKKAKTDAREKAKAEKAKAANEKAAGKKRGRPATDAAAADADAAAASPSASSSDADDSDDEDESSDSDDAKMLKGRKAAPKKAKNRMTAEERAEAERAALYELSEEELEAKRKAVLEKADKAASAVYVKLRDKWERDDHGIRVVPLGEDRYRRIVWYLPQDRRVLVQTAAGYSAVPDATLKSLPRHTTWGTPAITAPDGAGGSASQSSPSKAARPSVLVDEEDDEGGMMSRRTRGVAGRNAPGLTADEQAATTMVGVDELGLTEDEAAAFKDQAVWGYVALETLQAFIESLDVRGRREGPLRQALKLLVPVVEKQDAVTEGARMTRRAQVDFGYLNRQRPNESGWNW